MAAILGTLQSAALPLPEPLLFIVTVVTGFTGMNHAVTGNYVLAVLKFLTNIACVIYAEQLAGLIPSGNKSILIWFFYLAPWFTFDILQSFPLLSPNFSDGFKVPFVPDALLRFFGINTAFPNGNISGIFDFYRFIYLVSAGAVFFLFVLSKLPDSVAGPLRGPFNWILGSAAVFTPILAMMGIGQGGFMSAVAGMTGLPTSLIPGMGSALPTSLVPSTASAASMLPRMGGGVPSLSDVANSLKPPAIEQVGGGKEVDDGLAAGLFVGLLTIVAATGGGLAFLRSKE
jgi:hypothetical protein